MKSFHYRNYRLHGQSHPSVLCTTKAALRLTPSKSESPSLDKRRRGASFSYRSAESVHSALPYTTSVATIVTRDDFSRTKSIRSPSPPALQSLPVTKTRQHKQLSIPNKGTQSAVGSKLLTRYKPPTPPLSGHLPKSRNFVTNLHTVRRPQTLKTYQTQVQSYFAPRRGDVSLIGRKMVPVLRVLPTSKRTRLKEAEGVLKSESNAEITSQKKVRFSDQMGFPLARCMTPNYQRKHSYILRWLETAGSTAQAMH